MLLLGSLYWMVRWLYRWNPLPLSRTDGGLGTALSGKGPRRPRALLGGQITAQILLDLGEGGPVGGVPVPALEHELEQLHRLLQLLQGTGQHLTTHISMYSKGLTY